MRVPFNRAYVSGKEFEYMRQAWERMHLSADGEFTRRCQEWLQRRLGCPLAVLMTSGTDGLELASILADIRPADEVIMPSYTFVSTANAFVLRGAVPVFVDVRPDTLNLDETRIEEALTPKTKAIVPVHYAGIGCEMDAIMKIAKRHKLWVIEDAAQALGASYRGKPLGSLGHLAAFSFHETKNINCGEGGALTVNHRPWIRRAEICSQKGTDRKRFLRGHVDKYTWQDLGSSFMPGELTAAYLWGQFENAQEILKSRLEIWRAYDRFFSNPRFREFFETPHIPAHCSANGHIYWLKLRTARTRDRLIRYLNREGVHAIFHYIPLHLSRGGKKYTRRASDLPVTENAASCLLRLPLWAGMKKEQIGFVCDKVSAYFKKGML